MLNSSTEPEWSVATVAQSRRCGWLNYNKFQIINN
jgi:hypothetical protein